MSGYCRDCGNVLCICKLVNSNVSIEEHHKTYEELYFESLKIISKSEKQLKEAHIIAKEKYGDTIKHNKIITKYNTELVSINLSLKQQLKEVEARLASANEVIMTLNNKATGREYGLDAEDIWEISKVYIEKYGSEK